MASNIDVYLNHVIEVASKVYDSPADKVRLIDITEKENSDDPIIEYILEIGDRVRIVLREAVYDCFNANSSQDFRSKLSQSLISRGASGEILNLH